MAIASPLPVPSWTLGGFAGNVVLSCLNTFSPFKTQPRLSHYSIFMSLTTPITSISILDWLSTRAKQKELTIISITNSSVRLKIIQIEGEAVYSLLKGHKALTLSIFLTVSSKKLIWLSIKMMVFLNLESKEKANHCRAVAYNKAHWAI